jgi:hypothetical protein
LSRPVDALNQIKNILGLTDDMESNSQASEFIKGADFDEESAQSRRIEVLKDNYIGKSPEITSGKAPRQKRIAPQEEYNPENDVNDFLDMNRETIVAYIQPQKKGGPSANPRKGTVGSQSVKTLPRAHGRPGERQEDPDKLPNINKRVYMIKKKPDGGREEQSELQSLLYPKKIPSIKNARPSQTSIKKI